MEKEQSLAEFLGVVDPLRPEDPKTNPPPKTLTVSDFCKEVLSSTQYRESLLRRIIMGELPPAIEQLLYHYAHGKPTEKVEIKDTTNQLEDMTIEQLEQRAVFLVEVARRMKDEEQHSGTSSQEAVH
jgi:hypothetical protein